MKHLLLALLVVSFSSALADTPAKISEDFRKAAAAALGKVNGMLEKATTPLIAKLISSGDSAGAEQLTTQLKAKLEGEPVPTPHASATLLFAQYDQARAKALEPVQQASFARIDSLLKTTGSAPKLETVTELGKLRAEIEAGTVAPSTDQFFLGKSFFSKAGSEYHFNKDGTGWRLQKSDFDDKVAFTWEQRLDGVVVVQQRKQPTAPPRPAYFRFVDKKTAFLGDSENDINSQLRLN